MATRDDSYPSEQELNLIRQDAMAFAGIGLYRYTFDGTVLFMDEGALRLLEIEERFPDPREVVGTNIADLIVYTGPKGRLREEILKYRHVRDLQYPFKTLKGTPKWVLHNSYLVRDAPSGQDVIQVVIREITSIKKAQEDLEALISELEAKNAELERFTYTVSHDLKSPLITIKGFAGLLEQDIAEHDAERVKEDVGHIIHAADKMHRLLDDLLELSRIGRPVKTPQEVPLDDLVQEVVALVTGQIARRGVQVEIQPHLPVVYGDRPRLVEVVQNLIDNAVKFMGAQIAPRIEIGVRLDGDETVCYVSDNGIGIDPRHHGKVFGLFDKLDPTSEGTGVGLALVKRIVEVHGGRIWVESPGVGAGSTFCFTINPLFHR